MQIFLSRWYHAGVAEGLSAQGIFFTQRTDRGVKFCRRGTHAEHAYYLRDAEGS